MESTEKRWTDIKKMDLRREAYCKKFWADMEKKWKEKLGEKPVRTKAKPVHAKRRRA